MQIDYLDINDIKPYENNPRNNDDAVDAVAESIREFGFKVPIVIDENNVIVTGHTRYKASQQLGLTHVPCIKANDLTPEQVKAFRLADNKVSEIATWDYAMLKDELEEIDMDMSQFGFDEIEESDIEVKDDGFEFDDDQQELPLAKSKLGEIYQLGEHRLMVGDSTNFEHVSKLMDNDMADLVVTDPPYNVNVSNSDGLTIENDNLDSEDFRNFINAAFENLSASLKDGGAFYIWYGDSEDVNFRYACMDNGLTIKQCLIWVKNAFTLGRQDYQWRHEPCLYGWKEGTGHYFVYDRTQSTVFETTTDFDSMTQEQAVKLLKKIYSDQMPSTILRYDKPTANKLHPTMKPINLIAQLIKNSSETGEIVLDLFGGSGTTLIACEQLRRKCYMMEYDPHYADVIIDRYEDFTGNKAKLLNGDDING